MSESTTLHSGSITVKTIEADYGSFYSILYGGTYDRFIGRLTPNDTVIDGGANVGIFSLLISPLVKRVYAVEPDPTNFALLQQNIEGNRATNVTPVNAALSDRVGKGYLSGSGQIGYLSDEGTPINTTTIDELTSGRVDAIKLDIEGAEAIALRGQRATACARSVVFELDPNHMELVKATATYGCYQDNSYDALLSYLRSLGFAIEYFQFDFRRKLPRLMTAELIRAEYATRFYATRFFLGQFPFTNRHLFTPKGFPSVQTVFAFREK